MQTRNTYVGSGFDKMEVRKIAVVTGANKGVGFEIAKGLCQKFPGVVYLTARNEIKGKAAVQELENQGLHPLFHQLDVTDQFSVDKFKQHIEAVHGGLNVLVNNASIMFAKNATDPPFAEQAKKIMEVNYFGIIRVCDAFFPLLRNNAEVVNVSSSVEHLYRISSSAAERAKYAIYPKNNENNNEDDDLPSKKLKLNKLMEEFIRDAEKDKPEQNWGNSTKCCDIVSEVGISYIISKIGVSMLTFLQKQIFEKERPSRNISIKAVHPGIIKTELNPSGVVTPEEAARYVLLCLYDMIYI